MKSFRIMLPVVLISLATVAFAQSDAHKASAPPETPKPVALSEAQRSFETIKTFAGEWEGPVTVPEVPEMNDGKPLHLSLRVTSRGNAVVHEFQEANTP
jgi:hypothetical protein